MIQQMIYRGTSEGYRVVAISEGLAGKGLARMLQGLCRMPANWAGRAPIFSRVDVESGTAVMRTAVDPNGTRNHHITHIYYIPREDAPAFLGAGIPIERFMETYPDRRSTDILPAISTEELPASGDALPFESINRLFGGSEALLAGFLSAMEECAKPMQARKIKGICVLADADPDVFSVDAYGAMEALLRLYPGLWESAIGYRTLWTVLENTAQYPLFFSNPRLMPRRDQALNAGFLLIDVAAGACAFTKGDLAEPGEPVRQLAHALIGGDQEGAVSAANAIREAELSARRAAEAARLEAERREAERLEARRREAERLEAQRRLEEARRQEQQRLEEEARRRQEQQRQAEELARQQREREEAEAEAARKRQEEQRRAEEAERLRNQRIIESAIRQEQQRKQQEAEWLKAQAAQAEAQAEKRPGEAVQEPTAPETPRGVRINLNASKSGKVDDPVSLGKECRRKLSKTIADSQSKAPALEFVQRVDAVLQKREPEYHLSFLDAFLEDAAVEARYMFQQREVKRGELMALCASRMGILVWNLLFDATMPDRTNQECYLAAKECFKHLNRISELNVRSLQLQQEFAEWKISWAIIAGEAWEQRFLLKRIKNMESMADDDRRARFQRRLLALAGDYAGCVESPGDVPSKNCLTALFYAGLRFKGKRLVFDKTGMEGVMSHIGDRSAGKRLETELNETLYAAADIWKKHVSR